MTTEPSKKLRKMYQNLVSKSHLAPDHTWTSPNHREMDDGFFLLPTEYCAQHEFETNVVPIARANHWPLDVDFDRLHLRIFALHDTLQDLLHSNLQENQFFLRTKDSFKGSTSRPGTESIPSEFKSFEGESAG